MAKQQELLDSDVDVIIVGSNPLGRLAIARNVTDSLKKGGFKNVEYTPEAGTEDPSMLDLVLNKHPEILDVGINVLPTASPQEGDGAEDDAEEDVDAEAEADED